MIGGIPDQDPERLQRQFGLVADHLAAELGMDVAYEPVADYDAAVSAFRVGDLDLVWFGGLTGVQARLQVDGARAIAQRDVDAEFTSVFIASASAGIDPFDSVEGLQALAGRTFTFGSDSSTSCRSTPATRRTPSCSSCSAAAPVGSSRRPTTATPRSRPSLVRSAWWSSGRVGPGPPVTTLIQLEGVDVTYGAGDRAVRALVGIDLRVDAGERVAALGPSGSGKTTLLRVIGGRVLPSQGRARVRWCC